MSWWLRLHYSKSGVCQSHLWISKSHSAAIQVIGICSREKSWFCSAATESHQQMKLLPRASKIGCSSKSSVLLSSSYRDQRIKSDLKVLVHLIRMMGLFYLPVLFSLLHFIWGNCPVKVSVITLGRYVTHSLIFSIWTFSMLENNLNLFNLFLGACATYSETGSCSGWDIWSWGN